MSDTKTNGVNAPVPFPERSMVMWGESWWNYETVCAYADAREAELRRAVRAMSETLKGHEWAEHVSSDPDVTALEVEITELVGRVNAVLSADFAESLRRFERGAKRMGELWERCQGKGWPDSESAEFIELRDKRMPAIRSDIRSLVSGAKASTSTDGEDA